MTTQLTLYDDLPDAIDLPNRILYMRRVHGPNNADRCGTCAHFLQVYHFAKCAQYGSSASDATDWRQKWPACGLWRERED